MNKEKAEGLVYSLIDAASKTGYLSVVARFNSPYYIEAIEKRDELRDEIISYLTGERRKQ